MVMKKVYAIAVFCLFLTLIFSPQPLNAQIADFVQPESSGSSIKIVSLSPDNSESLYVGDAVEIEVEIKYTASKTPASIALNIQKGEMVGSDLSAVIATKMEVVNEKEGKIIIKQLINVPDTGSIQIFVAMMLNTMEQTSIVDSSFYKVIKK